MHDRQWSTIAVTTCLAMGVDHFFLAPGSRCTPLTLAVAHSKNAKVVRHFDERGLAFAALGYGRATGKPAVFICTSGTAVANAFPAVVEASMENVPMLLFTADRPPELRGTGANQTIDQQRIFGNYVRWFFDMPCPFEGEPNEAATQLCSGGGNLCRSQVVHAIEQSATGPVQLNWMFREPFTIEDGPQTAIQHVGDSAGRHSLELKSALRIDSQNLRVGGNTLVIAGGKQKSSDVAATELASKLNAPLLTDITSGLRRIVPDIVNQPLPLPESIIHVGGRIVSKAWLQYTAKLPAVRHIHLTRDDIRINPNHLALERVVGPLDEIVERIEIGQTCADDFRASWLLANDARCQAVERVLGNLAPTRISEPEVAFLIGEYLQTGDGLFIGNSSPIRDFDRYARWPEGLQIQVGANRGASGIDGLIATGAGFANGLERRTTIVVGDLSALHDLNSLALVAASEFPITLIIINNEGGGIFDMLPVSRSQYFEDFFATPHTFQFESAAAMFGLDYVAAHTQIEFAKGLKGAQANDRHLIVELYTNRKHNLEVRRKVAAGIAT